LGLFHEKAQKGRPKKIIKVQWVVLGAGGGTKRGEEARIILCDIPLLKRRKKKLSPTGEEQRNLKCKEKERNLLDKGRKGRRRDSHISHHHGGGETVLKME